MTPQKITDLSKWRAQHRAPASEACRWSESAESVALTNTRIMFAWQRQWLRLMWGA